MTTDPTLDHDPAGRDRLIAALGDIGLAYELFACDPALADTAAFCAAYGFAQSARRQSRRARSTRDTQGIVRAR
jgi:hypothetical protein